MNDEPSTAVAVRENRAEAMRPLPPMNDAEVAAAYRTAKALAESGLFKDAKRAGEAFAKILAGRDLGLTPFESMSALHVIEGKIEAGADLHATKVRQREGYDFEVWWIKADANGVRGAVKAEDEEPTDPRETVGCSIAFTVDGARRGVSSWTIEDSQRAGLTRETSGGKKSNHVKFPRSMFFARAMTNGVTWYVPEVMGGLRVYGLGDVPVGGGEDVAATTAGDEGAEGIEMPTGVEAVLARARSVGHMGIANRAAAEFALRGRSGQEVAQWIADRTLDLNRFVAGKGEPEPPPDAAVVEGEARPIVDPADVATEEELRVAKLADPEAFGEDGTPEARAEALSAARQHLGERMKEVEYAPPTPAEQEAANATGVAIVSDDFLGDGPPRRAESAEDLDADKRAAMRRRAADLLVDADAMEACGEAAAADDARAEAEQLYEQAGPSGDQLDISL